MGDKSGIEWTDATWNPVAGCTIISPGCSNCYAMRMAARLEAMGVEKYRDTTRNSGKRLVWTGRIVLDERSLSLPLRWVKPRKIFVNSMSDLFHEEVPDDFVAKVWDVMVQAPQHSFQVLTKRPERMARFLAERRQLRPPHIWLGTSVEGAAQIARIDQLRATEVAILFVSFEPLIASVGTPNLDGISWAIVGGESGPRARPMKSAWIAEIERACRRSGTAFFFKQWGGVDKHVTGRVWRGRTWDEFPEVPA